MKTKFSVLVLGTATMILVLVFVLGQSTTISTAAIHELTATEMAAVTGTGVCNDDVAHTSRNTNLKCNVGRKCNAGASAEDNDCGTDFTEYAADCSCSGPELSGSGSSGVPGCDEEDKDEARSIYHNCYCHNRSWPFHDECRDDEEPSENKARRCVTHTKTCK